MKLTSPAFDEGAVVPAEHTCEGIDSSPELQWTDVPEGVKSFALICDDPDAPNQTWIHWVAFNIPATFSGLPEGTVTADLGGGEEGVTDFKEIGYGGPCPPYGHGVHRYYFKLYALDTLLDLQRGCTKKDLLTAMEGHILDETVLMGRFERA